ncbi:MAG: TolC family protein [Phycisphaerae bacterium]|nr:TolC family protein [Phycisphaerae bacterium]
MNIAAHFNTKAAPRLALLAVAMALSLSGCVNQKKEVAHYRKILHAKPAVAAVKIPMVLTLSQAMRLANNNNEELAISGENYLQALIAKDKAFATFMPHVGIGASDFQMHGYAPPAGFPSSITDFYQTHYVNVPLASTLNVNVLKDATAISSARLVSGQRKAAMLDLQSSLLLEVAQTYYQVLSEARSVAVLKQTLKVQQARVTMVTHELKAGVALRLTVLQSQSDEANTRVQLTQARNNVVRGRATLAYLMGAANLNHARLLNDFNPKIHLPTLAQLQKIAWSQRQDLKAAEEKVAAEEKNVQAVYEQYFPSVALNFDTFLYKGQFPTDSWWSGLFSVNMPLFEGGEIYANLRSAYSQYRQAMLAAHQLRRHIGEEITIAQADWLSGLQLEKDLQTEMASSRSAYHQAEHSFKAGLSTNLDVITAQDQELATQLAYQQSRFQTRINLLNLFRVSGRLTYPAMVKLQQVEQHRDFPPRASKKPLATNFPINPPHTQASAVASAGPSVKSAR